MRVDYRSLNVVAGSTAVLSCYQAYNTCPPVVTVQGSKCTIVVSTGSQRLLANKRSDESLASSEREGPGESVEPPSVELLNDDAVGLTEGVASLGNNRRAGLGPLGGIPADNVTALRRAENETTRTSGSSRTSRRRLKKQPSRRYAPNRGQSYWRPYRRAGLESRHILDLGPLRIPGKKFSSHAASGLNFLVHRLVAFSQAHGTP